MDNRILVNQPLRPVQKNTGTQKSKQKNSFKKIFASKLKEKSGVKFSRHAQKRLLSRNIKLSETELKQLKNAVKKAEEKGSRDSLIMVNDIAYVVSVENKTVVTAVDNQSMKENVFTNIDSAVFM